MTFLLGFFTNPLGRVALIGIAITAWTIYQRDQAAGLARRNCQAEQLQQTVTELQRQRDAAKTALENAQKQAQQTAQEMQQLEAERAETLDQLKNSGDSCRVPDSTIERLRNIR